MTNSKDLLGKGTSTHKNIAYALVTSNVASVTGANIEALKSLVQAPVALEQMHFEVTQVKKTIQYFEENVHSLCETLRKLEKVRRWLTARKYTVPEITEPFPDGSKRWLMSVTGLNADITTSKKKLQLPEEILDFLV